MSDDQNNDQPHGEYDPGRQRRAIEWRLVIGGFAILLVIGGLLMWLLLGLTIALIGVVTAVIAIAIFALLWLILRALEAWARSD